MSGDCLVALDSLYENLLRVLQSPERFEFGDEVLDSLTDRAKPAFAKRLNQIAEAMGLAERVRLLREIEGSKARAKETQKEDFLLTLNRIFEKVRGEPEWARKIVPQKWVDEQQEALIEKYQMMSEEFYGVPMPLGINGDTVVSWDKTHLEFLQSESMLDDMVGFGNTLIKDFEDVWRVIFLAQASAFAPPIFQGEKEHRSQTHVLIIGEYSTSKSGFNAIIRRMFPRVVMPNDFTPQAMMGSINRKGEKLIGIAEECDRSILVLDEFDKLLKRYPHVDGILRVIMEEQHFRRNLVHGTLDYDTHPVVLAEANPKDDVFRDERLAEQVPFKQGFLSRFDYIRPVAYSREKITAISKFIAETAFKVRTDESGVMSTRDILRTYYALQSTLVERKVTRIEADESLVMDIHQRFCSLQREIDGTPLLSVRDFMSALRFFNASAVLHVCQRKVRDGAILADEADRDNAVFVLDNTTKAREALFTASERKAIAMTPVERAYGHLKTALSRAGEVGKREAVDLLMQVMGVGQATAYRYLSQIVARDKDIRQDGLRDAVLILAR
ncbi:MAG: hypothetical protein PHZ19_00255 [Candidatus Thermoplasmatota archaeon]|nr:hypothetical protein [Candidatus Thermoplasmatota archaeon]